MDDTPQDTPKKIIPFNNLYLVSGLVHGFNKFWMYGATLLLLVFGYLLFQSLIVPPLATVLLNNGHTLEEIKSNGNLLFDSDALKLDRNIVLLLELGMFVFGFIGFFIGIRYFHHKLLTSILTGYEKFRYKRFWFAFSIWGGLLFALVLAQYFLFPEDLSIQSSGETSEAGIHFNYTGLFISVLIMLVFMPVQTGLEEIVFRGYLVQGLSQIKLKMPWWNRYFRIIEPERTARIDEWLNKLSVKIFRNGYVPLIITSILFGLAHMTNPEVKAYGWPIMFTYFCGFALFMGALTLLDEGLELAFGIHFANNIISSVLVSTPNSVIKTYSVFETKSQDPYSEIWAWLCMATLTFFIFWLKYRWKNFSLILK